MISLPSSRYYRVRSIVVSLQLFFFLSETEVDRMELIDTVDLFLKDMDELDRQQNAPDRTANVARRPRTPRLSKKIPSWLRSKRELEALRQEREELETRVVFLQLQQVKRTRQLGISRKRLDQLHKTKLRADNEQQRRHAAQQENENLKKHLKNCLQVSRAFQVALATGIRREQSKLNVVAPASVICAELNARTLPQLQISSPSTFNSLEDRVNERFEGFQSILDEIRHTAIPMDSDHVQSEAGNTLEYKCTRVWPFDERATSSAAWTIVEEGGATKKQASNVTKLSRDVHAVDTRFALPLHEHEVATVDIHGVAKRFILPDGCVILAEATSEWAVRRDSSIVWSNESRESIWCVIRRFSLSCHEAGCQVNAVARSEAVPKHTISNTLSASSGFTQDATMATFRQLIESQRQCWENRLWDSIRTANT
ncbi:hypothetical protein F442_13159 [Phytophthora nicotianae P10297]|uniref:Uncharacterized protein n=1 Tax=Phytophthora nicotianae P10297 TaxID=1317064 RepID=W2YW54_PHYNI|nr:hypothetical protein F442_13159 [Phytophthora nicotianae P10297]